MSDATKSELSDGLLERIVALSPRFSQELYDRSPLAGTGTFAFDSQKYHVASDRSLAEGDPSAARETQEWLRRLPVTAETEVYLCWSEGSGAAIATDWQTFVRFWDDLWYPFDLLCVFDDSLEWALVLGPEEFAAFLRPGAVDPSLPRSDPSYGLRLVSAQPPGKKK